ncbi:PREDICTED: uncharacterized protein LOC109582431 [Amphimedon queenslandica]|uniref:Right handed beta helix domain-containing protein n=1 Tax=Amphimedon queenslandica TaxID=400682 RepID=A0AAN0J7H1_AMPQE|nr:PREDICTED: uncharacterized protein LOC109582431 [Amphimedon queenslandica]|eukprot:XP_019852697.1 PREDICTED: uncharacterized protein LOC109582431 [Amphimedon queenslandica]
MVFPRVFLTTVLFIISIFSHEVIGCSTDINWTFDVFVWNADYHHGSRSLVSNCSSPLSANVTIPYLQDALECVSDLPSEFAAVRVHLAVSKKFTLLRPISLGNRSICITASSMSDTPKSSGKPTIHCVDHESPSEAEEQYPLKHYLFFDRSKKVEIISVVFEACRHPLSFDSARNVVIEDSAFRHFKDAVLDIYNCETVTISGCMFYDNVGMGSNELPYRGNTGSVSIGYNDMDTGYNNPKIIVRDTHFVNNSAYHYRGTSKAFFRGIFQGRAGGLGIFINESYHNVSILVKNCKFINNQAVAFGGGLYFIYNGRNSYHTGIVEDSDFIDNVAFLGGGGFISSIISSGLKEAPHLVKFTNCSFQNNMGDSGGGMYFYVIFSGGKGNSLELNECAFIANRGVNRESEFGAAIAASIYDKFEEKDSFPYHSISDCVFINNTGTNGIVSLGYLPFSLSGRNVFSGNIGSALRVVGAQLTMSGEQLFIGNSAEAGGALYLLSSAQIRISEDLQMLFDGNSGRYGSAIFVDTYIRAKAFTHLQDNPLCFIVPNFKNYSPSEWGDKGINITFTRNKALFGSAIYASRLSACSWIGSQPPYFDINYFTQWPIFHVRDDNINTGYSDNSFNLSIITAANDIDIETTAFSGWPGQSHELRLKAIDELGNPTGSTFSLTYEQIMKNNFIDDVSINPNIFLITEEPFVANVTFYYNKTLPGNYSIGSIAVSADSASKVSDIPFNIVDCPIGWSLTSDHNLNYCQCDMNQDQVLACEKDQDAIVIKSHMWATHVYNQTPNLFLYECPPGYCQCFFNTSLGESQCAYSYSNSYPDKQCACGRTGILCGSCPSGKGVSVLFNKCITCSHQYVYLILALVIVDVLILLFIVAVDKPFPSFLYPFLFYIQIAPLATQQFPLSFQKHSVYLYYLSSFMGLYFPYDFCIDAELSVSNSYLLRFLPLLVSVVVISFIIVVRSYIAGKLCFNRCRPGVLKFHGLWLALLLVYPQTAYAAMSVLNCPYVPQNGHVWYFDGSLLCFQKDHLFVAIPAVIIAILLAIISILLLILAILTCKNQQMLGWLHRIKSSFGEPFTENLSWWSVVEINRRLLFLIVIIIPNNTTYLTLLIMCTMTLYGYVRPYKALLTNAIEVIVQLIFILLLSMQTSSFFNETFSYNATNITSDSIQCDFASLDRDTATSEYFLLVWYYMPLIVLLLGMPVIFLTVRVIGRLRNKRRSQRNTLTETSMREYGATQNWEFIKSGDRYHFVSVEL